MRKISTNLSTNLNTIFTNLQCSENDIAESLERLSGFKLNDKLDRRHDALFDIMVDYHEALVNLFNDYLAPGEEPYI